MNSFSSALCLIIYNHKLLLLLRDNNPNIPDPNTWSPIGGRRENNETPEETVIRETKEETNILLNSPIYLQAFEWDGKRREVFVSYITKEQFEEIKLGDEGQELDFFSFEQLHNLPVATTFSRALTTYGSLLKKLLSKNPQN